LILTGQRDQDGDYALNDLAALRQNPFRSSRDFEGIVERDVLSSIVQVRREGARVSFGATPHRSSPNRSSRRRRLLYLSYNAFSDGGEQRDRHYAEFADWLKDRYVEYGKTMTYFR
jgi:hypothetical protein